MDFRSLTVKECTDDPKLFAVIEKYVPDIKKYPIKLYNRKTLGELFDMVVSRKLFSLDMAKRIEKEINDILAEKK